MDEQSNAIRALYILRNFNRLQNDRDQYLYDVIEWGLGNRTVMPEKEDYEL